MSAAVEYEPRQRRFRLPARSGEMAALEFGPEDRPVDIVFSHANGFNARTYRTILAPLAGELRILAPDLCGHGASTLPADLEAWPGWHGFAADLLALLEAATDAPVVLAGHSLGATAGLLAAVERPDRVRSLVLFEPVLLPGEIRARPMWDLPLVRSALKRRVSFPDRAAALAAYRGRGAFASFSETELADYVAAGFRPTPGGEVALICAPEWEARTYAVHDYDVERALAELRRPARIFAGEVGSTVSPEARAAARAMGGLEQVGGASHFLPMERPDLARAALRAAAAGREP